MAQGRELPCPEQSCSLFRRWSEWLQHSSGYPVPRSRGVLENVSRRPALLRLQKDPGLCSKTALRCVHVHVPEPQHEFVQMRGGVCAGAPAQGIIGVSDFTRAGSVVHGPLPAMDTFVVMTLQKRIPVFQNNLLLCY